MVTQKLFSDTDVLVWKSVRIGGLNFLVSMRLMEIDAVQRTIDRNFPLGAATDSADFAAHAGAEALGAPCMTNRARHFLSIEEGACARYESVHQSGNRACGGRSAGEAGRANLPADPESVWGAFGGVVEFHGRGGVATSMCSWVRRKNESVIPAM